jgi:hypothetical protein
MTRTCHSAFASVFICSLAIMSSVLHADGYRILVAQVCTNATTPTSENLHILETDSVTKAIKLVEFSLVWKPLAQGGFTSTVLVPDGEKIWLHHLFIGEAHWSVPLFIRSDKWSPWRKPYTADSARDFEMLRCAELSEIPTDELESMGEMATAQWVGATGVGRAYSQPNTETLSLVRFRLIDFEIEATGTPVWRTEIPEICTEIYPSE